MKIGELFSVALPLAIVVVAAGLSLGANLDQQLQQQQQPLNGDGPILQANDTRPSSAWNWPKIPDYQTYKRLFNKVYSSTSEELRRAKLFAARALKVFISRIKYMTKRSTMYLRITPMSDWTDEERRSMYIHNSIEGPKSAQSKPDVATTDLEGNQPKRNTESLSGEEDEDEDLTGIADDDDERPVASSQDGPAYNFYHEPNPAYEFYHEPQSSYEFYHEPSPNSAPTFSYFEPNSNDATSGGEQSDDVASFFDSLYNKMKQKSKNFLAPAKEGGKSEVYLDYRDSKCIAEPKQQGSCGACYIFGITAALEYQYCKLKGQLVTLSEQFVIDCGALMRLDGCSGGSDLDVLNFVSALGIERLSNYPYKGHDDTCPYDSEYSSRRTMGFARADYTDFLFLSDPSDIKPERIQSLLEEKGPLTIAVNIHDGFADYGGGVDKMEDCDVGNGHAMLVVGHGVAEGNEYWLIRNSHGLNWGEDGYYKLSKEANPKCIRRVMYYGFEFEDNQHYDAEPLKSKALNWMV